MIRLIPARWLLWYRSEPFEFEVFTSIDGSWDFSRSSLEQQPLVDGSFDLVTGDFSFSCAEFDKRAPGINFSFNGSAFGIAPSPEQAVLMGGTAHYFSEKPRINPGGLVAGGHTPLISPGRGVTTLEMFPFHAVIPIQ